MRKYEIRIFFIALNYYSKFFRWRPKDGNSILVSLFLLVAEVISLEQYQYAAQKRWHQKTNGHLPWLGHIPIKQFPCKHLNNT